jgi:endonuclease/exonuclease/phosphatase (EEP) superfamily protein YafD
LLAFTPWVPVIGLAALTIALATRDRFAAIAAIAAIVLLAAPLVPRAWGSPDRTTGPDLRVMTVNLRVGGASPAAIVQLVRENHTDLLALQEFTPQARAALTRAGLDALLPYQVGDPEPLAIGSALYARVPLTDASTPIGPGGFVQATATLWRRVPARSWSAQCTPAHRTHGRTRDAGSRGSTRNPGHAERAATVADG